MFKMGLFVDGAFLPSYEGGTQRFIGLAEWMQRSGVEVTLFHCYRGWSSIDLISKQPYRTYFFPPERYHYDLDLIITLVRKHKIDIIVMTDYESVLKFGLPIKLAVPTVCLCFEVIDVFSDYQRSFGYDPAQVTKTISEESSAFSIADLCVCFSERDGETVRKLLVEVGLTKQEVALKVAVLPFGVHKRVQRPIELDTATQTVLFLGNFYHTPNARALEVIAKEIYPAVLSLDQQIRFLMVGDAPQGLRNEFSRDNFLFTGKVNDLAQVFRQASLALAPIFQGSGIKVKMLDYSLHGLPVICTSEALHGIVQEDLGRDAFLVEDDVDKYPRHILALLADPNRLNSYARAGHHLVAGQVWPTIIERIVSAYANCIKRGAKRPSDSVMSKIEYYRNLTPYHLVDHMGQRRFNIDQEELPSSVLLASQGKLEVTGL